MSLDVIAAVTGAAGASVDPMASLERHRAQAAAGDMRQMLGPLPAEGGAMIQPPKAVEAAQPLMTLPVLAGQFSEGLQHGFYTQDMGRLVKTLEQSRAPNSGVTSGDVTLELLNVQAKMGVADALRSVTTKLSEGLNTVVVKQG